jgi:peptidoglycan/xylan/chitin deacetylase (PgdA/CDA1 family)
VDPTTFANQMRWLAREGPDVVALSELMAAPHGTDAVAITFDDAFENFADVAHPLLRDLGLPVTLFVVSGRVGTTNAWGGVDQAGIPTLPLMGWSAIARVAEEGVELGGHTRSHPRLPSIPVADRIAEIAGCADDIEARTGRRPGAFAYPYGALDDETVAAAAGVFAHAVTSDLRPLGPTESPHRIPRLDMYYLRSPGRLEAWRTGAFRRHLRLRRMLRGLRSLTER